MIENDVKMTKNWERMIKQKSRELFHSWLLLMEIAIQITLSIYTFKYTHTTHTRIYNTMTMDEVMDTEMSEWIWTWWRW